MEKRCVRLGWALLLLMGLMLGGCKPIILSVTPSSPVTIIAKGTQVFTVKAWGTNLKYQWLLDNTVQSSTTKSFTYNPGVDDAGSHTLQVTVSNADGQKGYTWAVTVHLLEFSWEETYGGSGSDIAYAVIQTQDKGYLMAGQSTSSTIAGAVNQGGTDGYVVKTDIDGTVEWQTMVGGSGDDSLRAVVQTSDGGYVLAGDSESAFSGLANQGLKDFYIVKLSASGALEWQRMYGTTANDLAWSIRNTQDEGFIVAGHSTQSGTTSAYVMKLDADGQRVWENSYGSGLTVSAILLNRESIVEIVDAGVTTGYMLAGFKNGQPYVARIDATGTLEWENTYGGITLPGPGSACEIAPTTDGKYILTGWTYEYTTQGATETQAYTLKIDSSGTLIWSTLSGGSDLDGAVAVKELNDASGYLIAGITQSEDIDGCSNSVQCGTFDVYLGVLNTSGTCIYQERHGTLGEFDCGYALTKTVDADGSPDGYVVAGQAGTLLYDFYLVKILMY